MGFFLETLIGGLMTGMLYSLVALGFVLIFKASGVFNFAQGAMVLFAALAMARFSEWIPKLLGLDSRLLANVVAFAAALVVMIVVTRPVARSRSSCRRSLGSKPPRYGFTLALN